MVYHRRRASYAGARDVHLFRSAGVGITSVCGDVQSRIAEATLPEDAPLCSRCRLRAAAELAEALAMIGMTGLGSRVLAMARGERRGP